MSHSPQSLYLKINQLLFFVYQSIFYIFIPIKLSQLRELTCN